MGIDVLLLNLTGGQLFLTARPGKVIVATTEPNETVVLETIRNLGLEMQVKGSRDGFSLWCQQSDRAGGGIERA